jgi:sec-independent protein translocase protein TatA
VIDISPIQLLLVLAIALVVLGPRRLPQLGRDLGRGLREFRQGLIPHENRDPGPEEDGPAGEWTGPDPAPRRAAPGDPEGPA